MSIGRVIAAAVIGAASVAAQAPDPVDARAARLRKAEIVVDTHIDTPTQYRFGPPRKHEQTKGTNSGFVIRVFVANPWS
jgi:hypothetical protein